MSRLKPRRFLAILGSIVLLIGGYIGWQVYQGKQMANQYGAGKLAGTPGSKATTPGATSNPASQSEATPSPAGALSNPAWQFQATPSPAGSPANPSFEVPAPSGSSVNSSISSPSEAMSSGDYKQLMTTTYQQTLQTMQDVKGNTLALQGGNLSLSAYRSSILQAQATFNASEAFVMANPPGDGKGTPSYQEFMAGISLAKKSMGVILDGISSFSTSKLYAARDMGKTAQQQLIDGYTNFNK
ncbi:MAG TPA: hypothetical protein DD730_06375 [Desulfosporosinus sp.]|nr:hypothetical protein [Desulfosporosinus sp.]